MSQVSSSSVISTLFYSNKGSSGWSRLHMMNVDNLLLQQVNISNNSVSISFSLSFSFSSLRWVFSVMSF